MFSQDQQTKPKSMGDAAAEGAVSVLWRFFTGDHLDGKPRTNATWTHRGTKSTREDGRAANKWDHLMRLERMGVRLAASTIAAGTAYEYTQAPEATLLGIEATGLSAASYTAAYMAFRTTDGLLTWRHRRDWVWPLHIVLSKLLALPEGTKPSSYISLPMDFNEITGSALRVTVPADWSGGEAKGGVTTAIREKLALQDVTFSWHMDGRNHYVEATQSPRPRSKVLFSDLEVQALVDAAKESAPLIGLSHRNTTVSVDLDAESPHLLVSAGTGGGKSVILRAIFAQLLHNGAIGVVLDRKRHSHKWARGIPGVTYCRDIEDIHDELVRLGIEGDRRNRIVDDWEGEGDAPVGARMAILLEEVNATIGKLKRYWAEIRTKEDPKESPAIAALAEILFMGRAVKMHVLAVGQSMTAAALGGPEMRENFSTRILARYTRNAWNMLVPEVQPAPKATRHIGRAQVVLGGTAHETQVLFMTDAEARAWATSGTGVATSQGRTSSVHLGKEAATVAETGPGSTPPASGGEGGQLPGPRLAGGPGAITMEGFETQMEMAFAPAAVAEKENPITLKEATETGVLTASLGAARRASQRDEEFPANVGKGKGGSFLYWPEELRRWERNRPKAGNSTDAD
ncbi:helicase HerA domain-containing protein [Kitasatospora sp. MBT66]|uniref:helicase HerA domain-containing protein n=1 Tax=Kitasatospora sp. MBT66 TaxID=1444769 RepID=UPI0011EA7138|nr:DUF87 domain-containing protein [Kitasatospora sp. MBT66]